MLRRRPQWLGRASEHWKAICAAAPERAPAGRSPQSPYLATDKPSTAADAPRLGIAPCGRPTVRRYRCPGCGMGGAKTPRRGLSSECRLSRRGIRWVQAAAAVANGGTGGGHRAAREMCLVELPEEPGTAGSGRIPLVWGVAGAGTSTTSREARAPAPGHLFIVPAVLGVSARS